MSCLDERTKCSRGDQQQQLQAKGAVASFRHGLEVENDEKQSCTLGRASERCFEASGLLHSQQVNSGAMQRPASKIRVLKMLQPWRRLQRGQKRCVAIYSILVMEICVSSLFLMVELETNQPCICDGYCPVCTNEVAVWYHNWWLIGKRGAQAVWEKREICIIIARLKWNQIWGNKYGNHLAES